MKTDLSALIHGAEKTVEFCEDFRLCELCDEIVSGRAEVVGLFENLSGYIHFKAKARYDFTAKCDLCLDEFDMHYEEDIDLPVRITNEDDGESICIDGEEVDLHELLLPFVSLSLPTKFVCRSDCKGLCPVCGKNRNREKCNCSTKRIDPRLEKLGALLKSDEDKN